MSDPTVRPPTKAGAGRLLFNLDLYFLLNGFFALEHPDLEDAILEDRLHLVFLYFRGKLFSIVPFGWSVLLRPPEDNKG